MRIVLSLICLMFFTTIVYSQSDPNVFDSLVVSDVAQSRTVYFGIDPNATDGVDFNLGEANLPPFPPPPALEVRFILPEGGFSGVKSSASDFRFGTTPFSGQVEHRLKFQKGQGGSIKIDYVLPKTISIHVEDIFGGVLLNTDISGAGNLNIPDALDQLKLLINYTNATDVDIENSSPEYYSLLQNYPNPFNPSTKIQYSISSNQIVQLKIYDVLGKEITTLVYKEQSAGTYQVNFEGNNLTSGIYFYTIIAGDYTETKSMLLMK